MATPHEIQLSETPLSTVLLDLERKKSSVEIKIECSIGLARLWVQKGKLADASIGDLTGLEAARTLLALHEGKGLIYSKTRNRKKSLQENLSKLVEDNSTAGSLGKVPHAPSGSTLAMGSRIAVTDQPKTKSKAPESLKPQHKKTLQSRVPSQARIPAITSLTAGSHKLKSTENTEGTFHKPVPARLRKEGEIKPKSTGYSSVPPAALAEEHVPLPKSLRRTDPLPRIEVPREGSKPPPASIHARRITPLVEESSLSRTLGAAVVVPSSTLDQPSTYSSSHASDLPPDSPGSVSAGTVVSRAPSFDDEVVEAADGQLSDSEMPLPSTRLSIDALHQLQELNEAVSSRPSKGQSQLSSHPPPKIVSDRPLSSTASPHSFHGTDSKAPIELASRPSWEPPSGPQSPPRAAAPRAAAPIGSATLVAGSSGEYAAEQFRAARQHLSSSTPLPSSPSNARWDEQAYTGTHSVPLGPGSVPDPSALPGNAETSEDGKLPRVGRYEVLSRLKRGGMGSVYMCRLSTAAGFRRLFAMKVLHGHLASQPASVDAFFHEARVLGGLHHHNIVGIADVGSPEQPYIVLDYVEGGSLSEIYRATQKSARNPAVVVSVVLDALNGLNAAHHAVDEQGNFLQLVHCDVTPHNLLVGIDGTCRLTDFGIARTGESNAKTEVVQGKPGYLAPERILKRASDHRSDLFSMGVILYAGLCGVEPFAGANAEATMRKVLQTHFVPPSQAGTKPTSVLDLICMKALARDPNERFQSADEMATQLRQVAQREGLIATSTEVASWVQESLAPTLKARRVASMRGAASPTNQKRWATMPPPAVSPSGAAANPSTTPPNSSAENTGPVEPPSSRGYGEETADLSASSLDAAAPRRTRKQSLIFYAILMGLLLGIVWVVLRPEGAPGFLKIIQTVSESTEPHGKGMTQRNPPAQEPSEDSPEEKHDAAAANEVEDDPNRIVLPPIAPARESE